MQISRSYLLQKPKTSRKKRRLLMIMITVMFLVLAVVCAVHVISTFSLFHNSAEWAQSLRLQGAGNEVTYLVYGVDYWGANPYVERLILIHHDTINNTMSLVYLPGNTMIETAERDPEPLGQLYRRLRNPAFIELVQNFIGLPVNHYVELRYEGIAVLADYLGGVDAGSLSKGPAEKLLPQGIKQLTGFELYRFFLTADYREPPWSQLNRQRLALLQLWHQLEQKAAWQWPRLLTQAAPYVETDLDWRELAALKEQFKELTYADMKTITFPGIEETRDGCLYWVTDPEASADLVRLINEGYLVLPEEVTVEVLNGSGINGLAAHLKAVLEEEGFRVLRTGNADHFAYEDTEVVALGETPGKGRAIALFVPGSTLVHRPDPEATVDVIVIIGSKYQEYTAEQ
ncbi:MAG: LCP family protein [Bacillota bacterium]